MITIPIFQAEIDDGVAEDVKAKSSIAYLTPVEKFEPDDTIMQSLRTVATTDLSVASPSDPDLYYVKSILVTSSWNKNDDVFGAHDVWAARHTPEDKPTNIDHDETRVVGHMTECWAIDQDSKLIADDTAIDKIPSLLHIVNGSVIYLRWTDPQLQEQTDQLIQQIEAKTKFVSMECLFLGFDYAIKTDGNYEIQARTADSAYLTKYLRSYGGPGNYNGKQIGRFLRNIIFCGKGFVDSPANPESVILGKDGVTTVVHNSPIWTVPNGSTWTFNSNSLDTPIIKESITMADDNKVVDQVAELNTEIKDLRAQLAIANVDGFKKTITELEGTVTTLEASVVEKDAAITGLNDTIAKSTEKIDELTKANTEIQKALDEAQELELVAKRVSILVAGKIDIEKAKLDVEKFKGLDEDQFNIVAEALIAAVPKAVDTDDTDDSSDADAGDSTDGSTDDSTDDNVDNADADLDQVKPDGDETTLAANVDGDEGMKAIRSQLQDFVRGRLGIEEVKDEN